MPDLDRAAIDSALEAGFGESAQPVVQNTPEPTPSQPVQPVQATPTVDTPVVETQNSEMPAEFEVQPDDHPAIVAQKRALQSHFTRQQQTIAPIRHVMERLTQAGVPNEQIAQYIEIAHNINTNPEYARMVANHINQQFADPANPDNQPAPVAPATSNPLGNELLDDDPLVGQVTALEGRLADFENRARENDIAQNLIRQESVIREMHPDWDASDMDEVYKYAHYTKDLMAASELYLQSQGRMAKRFLAGKLTVPTGTQPNLSTPVPTTTVEQPKTFEEARRAGLERIRQAEMSG